MFKPEEKVSINERPYSLINLKFITAIDMSSDSAFSVTTPLRKFVFGCKHEVAATEWVNQLRLVTTKKNKSLPPMKHIVKKVSDNGYHYSKDISKRLSIVETFADGKQKTHKIKPPSSTMGRSGSNTIRLTCDKYISRSHFKIVIENNVPFLEDLGQSKKGTTLNDTKVTKAPLKPGDLIGIGKSQLVFLVKDGISIFSQNSVPQLNVQENGDESPPLVPSDDESSDNNNKDNKNDKNSGESDDKDDESEEKKEKKEKQEKKRKKRKKKKNRQYLQKTRLQRRNHLLRIIVQTYFWKQMRTSNNKV